ncbi:unnamed protein product [Caenorhabditis angaria]|uniref:Uncharacterized protein n=1 Tax=Caenorhabditis angaria TaxID=860376 RepID=A0A9P1IHK1_9PELO|nr:unnamed protein product [Caenorhabditis angaria]CAI5444246.1 unnamed protein product [Caenorhabditis angaria]
MRFVPGQRCLIVWLVLMLTLIALVMYLDSLEGFRQLKESQSNQNLEEPRPIFLALVLFITDLASYITVFYKFYHFCVQTPGSKFANLTEVWQFIWPRNQYFVAQLAVLTLKVLFQIFLFLRLIFHVDVPILLIFIPFWGILLIILYDLTMRLYRIQKED